MALARTSSSRSCTRNCAPSATGRNRSSACTSPSRTAGCDRWVFPRSRTGSFNRNAHQAIDAIRQHLTAGFVEVYDADLKSYFDTIPHNQLLKCLERRIADRSVLTLIRMWLAAPVTETDDRGRTQISRTTQGVPQGGSLSPLLANLYLHWFEKAFGRKDGPGTWANAKLVRYADDCAPGNVCSR